MSLLTDVDIEKRLGTDIVINPYDETNLTPVGYDITVGSFVYLLGGSILQPDERGIYEIPARSTVLVWSNECIFVSNRTAGLLHSCVSNVSRGLSHISTTIDPNWAGTFLVAISNLTDKSIPIQKGEKLATIVFLSVRRPAKRDPGYEGGHPQIVARLATKTKEDAEMLMHNYVANQKVQEEFLRLVKAKQSEFPTKVAHAVRRIIWRQRLRIFGGFLLGLSLATPFIIHWLWEAYAAPILGAYNQSVLTYSILLGAVPIGTLGWSLMSTKTKVPLSLARILERLLG